MSRLDKLCMWICVLAATLNFVAMFRAETLVGEVSLFLCGMFCVGLIFGIWHENRVSKYITELHNLTSAKLMMEVFAARSRNKQPYDDPRIDPLLRKASSTDSAEEEDALYQKAAELWRKEQVKRAADKMSTAERIYH